MKEHKIMITGLFFILSIAGGYYAQETVTTSGAEAAGSGGSSSYTVGQIAYTNHTGTTGHVAEGVQQPYEIWSTVGVELTEIDLELTVYPNPTQHTLTLTTGDYNKENLRYELYDLQGKLLESKFVTGNTTTIGSQYLPTNTYLLNVLDDRSIIKTFKIVKK